MFPYGHLPHCLWYMEHIVHIFIWTIFMILLWCFCFFFKLQLQPQSLFIVIAWKTECKTVGGCSLAEEVLNYKTCRVRMIWFSLGKLWRPIFSKSTAKCASKKSLFRVSSGWTKTRGTEQAYYPVPKLPVGIISIVIIFCVI